MAGGAPAGVGEARRFGARTSPYLIQTYIWGAIAVAPRATPSHSFHPMGWARTVRVRARGCHRRHERLPSQALGCHRRLGGCHGRCEWLSTYAPSLQPSLHPHVPSLHPACAQPAPSCAQFATIQSRRAKEDELEWRGHAERRMQAAVEEMRRDAAAQHQQRFAAVRGERYRTRGELGERVTKSGGPGSPAAFSGLCKKCRGVFRPLQKVSANPYLYSTSTSFTGSFPPLCTFLTYFRSRRSEPS